MEPVNYIEFLPKPALLAIVKAMDIKDLARLSQTRMRSYLSEEYVLEQLSLVNGLPITKDLNQFFQYSQMEPADLLVLSAENGDSRVIESILSRSLLPLTYASKALGKAASRGDIDLLERLFKEFEAFGLIFPDPIFYNEGLVRAAEAGHLKIVEMFLDLGANKANVAMAMAAQNGHIDIVQYMLDYGAMDYDWAFTEARDAGHKDIADLLSSYGAYDWLEI